MSRETILGRIRAATTANAKPALPVFAAPESLTSSGVTAESRFRSAAIAKGVIVVDVPERAKLPEVVARALAPPAGRRRALRINDPALASLPWQSAGIDALAGAAGADDDAALSRAMAAVAETGTIVLASEPANPTTLAFLPVTHLVTIERESILGTFEDALVLLRKVYGRTLPRSVNFVSGASRTGDIGGRIVHGAQGPGRLVVFLL
ncbi:MAG: LutC/YkgG family protein [Deltaproteobacteria bacterium]